VTDWLCIWNDETHARNEPQGVPSERIHIPHGRGRIAVGDVIYCMVTDEKKEMMLLRRIEVASIQDDPEDEAAILIINDADADRSDGVPREVSPEVVEAMRYEDDKGSLMKMPVIAVLIDTSSFRGRKSLHTLAEGADELDALL
jgi:hypothetical protein